MQSKTMNHTVLWIGLLLMNGMVVAFVRPVNPLGIVVMNITAIAIIQGALRFLRK